jgi:hypothetical protein
MEIRDIIEQRGIILDGTSSDCPFWVHTTAWPGIPFGQSFISKGFWKSPGPDTIPKAPERFVKKTAQFRELANSPGILLTHEIYPGTAAMFEDEVNMLVKISDEYTCLSAYVDPPRRWTEEIETRFQASKTPPETWRRPARMASTHERDNSCFLLPAGPLEEEADTQEF